MNHKLAAALLLLPLTLTAQDAGATQRSRARATSYTLTMEFSGGTMGRFIRAINENLRTMYKDQPSANILLASGAEGAVVPPMKLKDAGLEQALEGACMSAEADFQVRVKEFRGEGQPVYSIVAYKPQGPTQMGGPTEPMRRVFSLNSLTAKRPSGVAAMKVSTILSAIDMTVSDSKTPALIRYHEDSGLLLVRGSHTQLRVVEEALMTMENDLQQREQREMRQRQLDAVNRGNNSGGGNGKNVK